MSEPFQYRLCLSLAVAWLRNFRSFFRHSPGTPLRVLGLIWVDACYAACTVGSSRARRLRVAALLHYHAELNRVLDGKTTCRRELRKTRRSLFESGFGATSILHYTRTMTWIEQYGRRISGPTTGARLSLTRHYREAGLEVLNRALFSNASELRTNGTESKTLALMCLLQILDDKLDLAKDRREGQPTFLSSLWDSTPTSRQRYERRMVRHYRNICRQGGRFAPLAISADVIATLIQWFPAKYEHTPSHRAVLRRLRLIRGLAR
ncbi:MAG: hypothetical protein U0136_21800 [Bdellovibrionota bacterium]